MIGMRAEPFDCGAPEFIDLEWFMSWRSRGLSVETPAVRPRSPRGRAHGKGSEPMVLRSLLEHHLNDTNRALATHRDWLANCAQ